MISADEVRTLMDRKHYIEKIKEYEEKIEKDIVQAAKNNQSMIITTLEDDDSLFQKALYQVLANLTDNGFEVSHAWGVGCKKYMIAISW